MCYVLIMSTYGSVSLCWLFFFSPILKNPSLFVFKDGLFNVTEELSDSDCLFQRYNNRHSHLEHLR